MATRIIAFLNNKGGTCKTTSVFNIAHALKRKNKKVLCIDTDAQANLTLCFGIKPNEHKDKSINQVLKGELKATDTIITIDNIDIIPSNLNLSFTELELFMKPQRETLLKRAIEPIKDNYDFILIDTAPNLLLLTQNALTFATELLTPTEAEYFALQGVAQLLLFTKENITNLLNPTLKFSGAFITNYDARKNLTKDVEAQYKNIFKDTLFKSIIYTDVALAESPSYHKSIFDYKANSKGAKSYEELTNEIIALEN